MQAVQGVGYIWPGERRAGQGWAMPGVRAGAGHARHSAGIPVGGTLLGQPSSKARALRFLPPVRQDLGLGSSPPHPALVGGTRPQPGCESCTPCLSTCPAGWGQPSLGPTPHPDWLQPQVCCTPPLPLSCPGSTGRFRGKRFRAASPSPGRLPGGVLQDGHLPRDAPGAPAAALDARELAGLGLAAALPLLPLPQQHDQQRVLPDSGQLRPSLLCG